MIQTFTLDDAVRFVYREMNSEEAERMNDMMLLDSELMDVCQQLDTVKRTLESNPITREPSQRVIDNILSYSKSYNAQVPG